MRKVVTWVVGPLSILILLATLISLWPSDHWFVRVIDLVREPLMFAALALALVALLASSRRALIIGALLLAAAINFWRIWPYFGIAGTEIENFAERPQDADRCFTALAVNVKVKNDNFAAVAAQIERVAPDVLLLMETDARWVSQLAPVLGGYAYTLEHPQPEAFGLVFASRLPVESARAVENTHRDTPTLYATMRTPAGDRFEFIGLHPKPPLPGWDTEERDRNIVRAGVETPDMLRDALVMGDFNDVPWSRTTTRFREEGGWLDPRIGRGSFPTFPSAYRLLGWPLDQVMVKGDIAVADFTIMPDNSSDHRAVRARLCHVGDAASAPAG